MAGDAPCYHAAALCNAALIETSIPPCQYTAAASPNVATSRPALDSTGDQSSGSDALFRVEVPRRKKKFAARFQGNFSNHRGNINTLIPIKHLTSVCVQLCGERRKHARNERVRSGASPRRRLFNESDESGGSSRSCDR